MLRGRKHERRVLQIHQDHVDAGGLELPYPGEHAILETVGAAAPGDVVGAELPNHEVRRISKHVAVEARDTAADRLADPAAVDNLDARIRPQPGQLAAHHLRIRGGPAHDPQTGGRGGADRDDAQRRVVFEPRRNARQGGTERQACIGGEAKLGLRRFWRGLRDRNAGADGGKRRRDTREPSATPIGSQHSAAALSHASLPIVPPPPIRNICGNCTTMLIRKNADVATREGRFLCKKCSQFRLGSALEPTPVFAALTVLPGGREAARKSRHYLPPAPSLHAALSGGKGPCASKSAVITIPVS